MAKWGSVDYSQLKTLQKKMQRMEQNDINKFCEDAAKNIAARLLRKVIKNTPVVSGDLRRAWTTDNSNIKVRQEGNDFIIDITNTMFYASYFEYGHRTADHKGWVKGHFVLTKAETELNAQSPKILEKMLENRLKELFND